MWTKHGIEKYSIIPGCLAVNKALTILRKENETVMKNKITKILLSLTLCGSLMVGCLTGCGPTQNASTSESQNTITTNESVATESEAEKPLHPVTTEPVTISILTQRHTNATNNVEDVWFFQYLEYWLAEQGYNVTLDVQQTSEPDQQISLLLGTDTLPDLVWGIPLSNSNAVLYGAGEGMLLDWTPYINDTYMPNINKAFQTTHADALLASTCLDGGVYSIPKLSNRVYQKATANFGIVDRMFINTTWLEQCGLNMPTNLDEFLNMLRTFKTEIKLESGDEVIPLLNMTETGFLERVLWTMHGYYGDNLSKYGTTVAFKDGKVVLPAYTDDYKSVISIMNTLYTEGLISEDYFSMDKTTMRGLTKAGVAGAVCDSTMGNLADFTEWECMPLFPLNGTKQVAISASGTYNVGSLWASAETEYPEIVALIVDYLYSPEGAAMYFYGPMEGQDPLNLVDGWYLKEDNNPSTKMVDEGQFTSFGLYTYQYIMSYDNVGYSDNARSYVYELAKRDVPCTTYEIKDVITGEAYSAIEYLPLSDDNVGGYWNISNSEASTANMTTVRIPSAYMLEEDALRYTELSTVLDNYIITESAKFITGLRPLEEIDDFFKELEGMNVKEFVELSEEAYASYMAGIFK